VIAEQANIALHDQVDTLARIRPVTDNIAEAIDLSYSLRLDVSEDRLEAFEITVDVADERALHGKVFLTIQKNVPGAGGVETRYP
jgi:hypothetical protein